MALKSFTLCILTILSIGSTARADLPNIENLKKLVSEKRLTSIDEVIPLIHPSLLRDYVLVFESRSVHGSSFRDPRVLLFNNSGNFIVSFNGQPSQAGYNELEMMEFDEVKKEFHFFEMHFPSQPAKKDEKVTLSEPQKCFQCHQSPARPIWDSFPTWPGVYGERYQKALNPTESQGVKEFLANQKNHPRYRHLREADKFEKTETFFQSSRDRYAGVEADTLNSKFSRLLTRLSFKKIANDIVTNSAFRQWGYALLGSLRADCGQVDGFLDEAHARFMNSHFAGFAAAAKKLNRLQREAKLQRLTSESRDSENGEASLSDFDESIDAFRFVVEYGLSVRTSTWALPLEKDGFDFKSADQASGEIEKELIQASAGILDEKIQELYQQARLSSADKYCRFLRVKSREALGEKMTVQSLQAATPDMVNDLASRGFEPAKSVENSLSSCIQCHEQGVGPKIHFSKPAVLAAELNQTGYGHGTLREEILFRLSSQAGARRMPRGRLVSPAEQQALIQYFQGVKE